MPERVASLSDMDDRALLCRDTSRKHQFQFDHRQYSPITNGHGIVVMFTRKGTCDCGATCEEDMNGRTMQRQGRRRVSYPDGYLLQPGSGRIPGEDARRELFVRHLPLGIMLNSQGEFVLKRKSRR